jgi:hypothetical protein
MRSRLTETLTLLAILAALWALSGCREREPNLCQQAGNHYVDLFRENPEVAKQYPNPMAAARVLRKTVVEKCVRGALQPECVLNATEFTMVQGCY